MDAPFVWRKAEGRCQLAAAESGPDAGRHVMPGDASDKWPAEKRESQRQPATPWLAEDEHTKPTEPPTERLKFIGTEVVKNQVPHGNACLLRAECLKNVAGHPSDPPVQARRSGNKIQSGDGAVGKTGGEAIAKDSFPGAELNDSCPGG